MIIGIAGTQGSGKGTVVEILKKQGFTHCSARALIVEEIEKRGLEVNRTSMSETANALRAAHGAGYVTEELLRRRENIQHGDVVVESIYTTAGADAVKEKGGVVIAVDANPRIRYQRIVKRGSETDAVSEEEFLALQEKELYSDDPKKHNARAVMEQADFKIQNDGTLEELRQKVSRVLKEIRT